MSARVDWWGPPLVAEQRDLAAMLDAFVASHEPTLTDESAVVAGLVSELAELGVWTLGSAEQFGGGGADRQTTALVFERLGRSWPGLGWAAAQAHTAVDVLGGDERFTDLVTRLHAGTAAVAVVDAAAGHVHIERDGATVRGTIARVDAAAAAPYLLMLGEVDEALLLEPVDWAWTPLRRSGFDGALTRSVQYEATGSAVHELHSVDVAAVRGRLRLAAAAIAAGIAAAAAAAATDYATQRHQFGAALTALPTVRQTLLEQTGRATVGMAAALGADGEIPAAAAVIAACDGAIEVAASALQSHGGYGYLTEYGAERRLRDAVSLRAAVDSTGAAVRAARSLVGLAPTTTALRKDAS